jgi:DNA polymerase elongation subunit (family B)
LETNFISCVEDFNQNKVMVWERPIGGGPRTLKFYDPPRYFFVQDDNGPYETITNVKVSKVEAGSASEFKELTKAYRNTFEVDIRPDARVLMNEYFGRPTPVVNYAFFDIEVDVNSKMGWANPQNAYAAVNALTLWQSWTQQYKCYAVPPKNWSDAERLSFNDDVKKFAEEHRLRFIPEFILCRTEEELLSRFIQDIQDCDILSGWNSELFDIPYVIERLKRVYGKDIGPKKLCFPGAEAPRMREVEVFGNVEIAYDLKGRTHVDYMEAFKKFTFEGRTSYSLANIAADELDVDKIDTGLSFEEMYNDHFFKFCVYNARDVEILKMLNDKFNFIQLINQMAHENTVPYGAIMGTVRYVDMGITNRVHRVHNKVTINKPIVDDIDHGKVEGAVVFDPLFGLWKWIGSVDINSLYPSVIRALNMSYETFVGQFHNDVNDWRGIMDDRQRTVEKCPNGLPNVRYRSPEQLSYDYNEREYSMLHVRGDVITKTAPEWREWFRENNYAISAFGTVFDQTQEGVVAETLTFWFAERKRLQAEKKKWGKKEKELLASATEMTAEQFTEFKQTGSISDMPAGMKPYKKKLVTEEVYNQLLEVKHQVEHYDLLQLTKKIQL